MEKVKIFYAYNGFLYAPLLLADKIGLFPKNLELICTSSDSEAVRSLCSQDSSNGDIHFAICDPFAANFDSIIPEYTDDQIYIIGSLINKVPFWIYNTNKKILPVQKEEDLVKYVPDIKNIVSYRDSTTGFLFGCRICSLMKKSLITVDFGDEFAENSDENLIITADFLKMVDNGLNNQNIVFPYSTRTPKDINPFLFTGILTLKENIDKELWAVLNLLGALQIAISHLKEPVLQKEIKDYLKLIYSSHPSIIHPKCGDPDKLLSDTCGFAFKNQKLYDGFPRFDAENWAKAWTNSKREWEKVHPENHYPEVETISTPFPALLIKPNWESNLVRFISDHIRKELSEKSGSGFIKQRDILPKRQYILTIIMLIAGILALITNVACGFQTFFPVKVNKFVPPFYLLSICTVLMGATSIWGFFNSFVRYNPENKDLFNTIISIYATLFMGVIACLLLIVIGS